MADTHQAGDRLLLTCPILLDKTRARNAPEVILSDKPRPGAKRPFCDGLAIAQGDGLPDAAQTNEHGLISSYTTNSTFPSAPLRDGDVREYLGEDGGSDSHTEKRSRTSDWPLRSNNAFSSASPPRCASLKPRPSKFVEGSMNDRASRKPHPSYIGDSEQLREQLEAEPSLSGDAGRKPQHIGFMHHANRSAALSVANDKLEPSRSSSIFRFGRSVAAAFNPSSWKIWSNQHGEDSQEKKILKGRHEKAEKIYRELKRTGQLKGSTFETHTRIHDRSTLLYKHDSGVDLEQRVSTEDNAHGIGPRPMEVTIEEKRYGRIFLNAPSIGSLTRSDSPGSEISAPLRDSLFHHREPTLQTDEVSNGPQALRRLPSRKDLQKQQKLVKRVSDLEGKLEAARRQLAEALGEPVPDQAAQVSRSRFTPGTLASLPSERLLSVYIGPEPDLGDAGTSVGAGRAKSIDDRTSSYIPNDNADNLETKDLISSSSRQRGTFTFGNALVGSNVSEERQIKDPVGGAQQEDLDNLTPTRQTAKKRKSFGISTADDGGRYKPTLDSDDCNNSEAPITSIPKRGPGRPRKFQRVDPEPKLLGSEPNEAKCSISGAVMEANSLHSFNDCKTKTPTDGQVVLSKAASSANNSRIPRKGRYSTSPPPPMSSSGIRYAGQEVSTGKTAEKDEEGRDAISIVHSANVPPIPKITAAKLASSQRKGVPASDKPAGSRRGTAVHDNLAWTQKESDITSTDVKKDKARSKQAFEWPADVF